MVVLMNDGERQIGCRYALLIDRCVDERRLLGGGMSVVDDELMDDDHERSSVCVPDIKNPEAAVGGKTAEHHVRIVITLSISTGFIDNG